MNRAYKETIHSMKATGLASSINTLQTSHDKPVYRQSGSLTKAKLRSDNLFKIRCGELAEWLMAPVLKTGIPERVSGVRIPHSPPVLLLAVPANRRYRHR